MYWVYVDGKRLPFVFYNIVAAMRVLLEIENASVVDSTTGAVLVERE